jgi:hypothetical protein
MNPQKLARLVGKASRFVSPAERSSYTKFAFEYAKTHLELDEEMLYSHLIAMAMRW